MQYLPTIDLWNPAFANAIRNGQLKLQVGQWVKCGGEKPSRFVTMRGNSVWAVHPEGEEGVTMKRFSYISKVWRGIPTTKEQRQGAGYA